MRGVIIITQSIKKELSPQEKELSSKIAERLTAARTDMKLTQESLQDKLSKRDYDLSLDSIRYYEQTDEYKSKFGGNLRMAAQTIIEYCQIFNVSADYLLGLSDVKSPDTSMQGAVEYAGLSEQAIENIRKINRSLSFFGPNTAPSLFVQLPILRDSSAKILDDFLSADISLLLSLFREIGLLKQYIQSTEEHRNDTKTVNDTPGITLHALDVDIDGIDSTEYKITKRLVNILESIYHPEAVRSEVADFQNKLIEEINSRPVKLSIDITDETEGDEGPST